MIIDCDTHYLPADAYDTDASLARSFWGAVAPDSWYEESTELLGPDGRLIPTTAASLDERRARTQVMA